MVVQIVTGSVFFIKHLFSMCGERLAGICEIQKVSVLKQFLKQPSKIYSERVLYNTTFTRLSSTVEVMLYLPILDFSVPQGLSAVPFLSRSG